MSSVKQYLEAATRANTERAYAGAIRHFEVEWGGHLPATAEQVARYLAAYAGQLALNTLRHRLAALAQWHQAHGFADPTRAPVVRKVLKGIQTLHPSVEKRATPLQLTQLGQVTARQDDGAAGDLPGGGRQVARHLLR
ncbi:Tn3 family resolvase, partial [Xanthomonas perforans]